MSILRKFWNWLTKPKNKEEAKDLLRKSKQALEYTYLNKPAAESSNLLAQGTASLITALLPIDNACLHAGNLLVIKKTEGGVAKIISKTISPEFGLWMEKNPQWLFDPDSALSALSKLDQHGP
jgi:hypothetical protein